MARRTTIASNSRRASASPGRRVRRATPWFAPAFGLFFNDLAQTGWATAFRPSTPQAGSCVDPVQILARPKTSDASPVIPLAAPPISSIPATDRLRDPRSAGIEHAFSANWPLSADYIHEQGNHAYRAYSYTGGTNLFTPRCRQAIPGRLP